jgi:hypothetical protein
MSRLQPEQEELLSKLVEAYRNVDRDHRQQFYLLPQGNSEPNPSIEHPGLQGGTSYVYMGDLLILTRAGLLFSSNEGTIHGFDITPEGFVYYERLKKSIKEPGQRIENHIRSYIDTAAFQQKYPTAYKKWAEAEVLLWSTEPENNLTTIGHLCREAIQEFSANLVKQFNPPDVDCEKQHTKNRIKAVLYKQKSKLGVNEFNFLEALAEYWDCISDMIQKQEHDSQKEAAQLIWEDGRRVVFQTAVVMYEVDRAVSRLVS